MSMTSCVTRHMTHMSTLCWQHELFFSFHEDTGVHSTAVLNIVTVYFTSGNPMNPQRDLRRGEYYCRALWDPEERQVLCVPCLVYR